jgi:hypothetical protein
LPFGQWGSFITILDEAIKQHLFATLFSAAAKGVKVKKRFYSTDTCSATSGVADFLPSVQIR